MNIIFLCSLIFLSSSSVLNQLAPLKKIMNKSLITIAPLKKIADKQLMDVIMNHQKDPAYLLSVLSNVDPTQLNAVIVLIRALLADSESELVALNLASTNANTAYTDATVAYDAAALARSRLETAYTDENVRLETVYTAQSVILDQQVNDLFVVQTEAHGAKTNAQGTLDTEQIRLNGEIATLKQVIVLLDGLGGSTSGLSNDNAGCYLFAGEADCLRSKDGRQGASYTDSPCDWCCGDACTGNNNNKCEPHQWLMNKADKSASKNGAGYDTCPAEHQVGVASLSTWEGEADSTAAKNCIDGTWQTYCHCERETNPYFMMEYPTPITVAEVKVETVRYGYGHRMQKVHVYVTDTPPTKGSIPSGTQFGSTFVGPARDGEWISFKSANANIGKYVVVQQEVTFNYLQYAEVEVIQG